MGEGAIPVEVVRSGPASAHLIRNLYPLYLHDLSEFSGELPNAHGVYEPDASVRTLAEQADLPYQRAWLEEQGPLHAFILLVRRSPAGFAIVSTPPHTSPGVQFRMQEFFVVRPHRRKGVARRAAIDVFERFRGAWELAVLPQNLAAERFWRGVIGEYTRGRFSEGFEPRTDPQTLRSFRFDNSARSTPNTRR